MASTTATLSSFLSDVDYPTDDEIAKDWNFYDKFRWGTILPAALALLFIGSGPSFSLFAMESELKKTPFRFWSSTLLDDTAIIMSVICALGFILVPLLLPATTTQSRLQLVCAGLAASSFLTSVATATSVLSEPLFYLAAVLEAFHIALLIHTVVTSLFSWFPDLASVSASTAAATLFVSFLAHKALLLFLYHVLGLSYAHFLIMLTRTTLLVLLHASLPAVPSFLPLFINAVIVATTASTQANSVYTANSSALSTTALGGVGTGAGDTEHLHIPSLHSSLKLTARLPRALVKLRQWKEFVKRGKRRRGYGELVDEGEARDREEIEMGLAQAFGWEDEEEVTARKNAGKYASPGKKGRDAYDDSDLEDIEIIGDGDVLTVVVNKQRPQLPAAPAAGGCCGGKGQSPEVSALTAELQRAPNRMGLQRSPVPSQLGDSNPATGSCCASKSSAKHGAGAVHRRAGDSDDESDIASFAIEEEEHVFPAPQAASPEKQSDGKSLKDKSQKKKKKEKSRGPLAAPPSLPLPPPPSPPADKRFKPGMALSIVASPMDRFVPLPLADLVPQSPLHLLLAVGFLAPLFALSLAGASPALWEHLLNAPRGRLAELHYSLVVALIVSTSLAGVAAQVLGHRLMHKLALLVQLGCLLAWETVVDKGSFNGIWALVVVVVAAAGVHLVLVPPMAYKYLYAENAQTCVGLVLGIISMAYTAAPFFTAFFREPLVENNYTPDSGVRLNCAAYTWCARAALLCVLVAFICVHKLKQLPMAERIHA